MALQITEERIEDGWTLITGHFTHVENWSFELMLYRRAENNDCWVCSTHGRIAGATLLENGKAYYSCPADEYDNRERPLHDMHLNMFAQLQAKYGQ